jgi:3D (Asp-Asp-Asp) domain-containing protein
LSKKTLILGCFLAIFWAFWAIPVGNLPPKPPEIPPQLADFDPNPPVLFPETPTKTVSSTFYTPKQGWKGGKITASGTKPKKGIIAVSRDLHKQGFDFGKRVLVHNVGVFTIEDLMGKKQKNKIDFFTHDYGDAKKWGRQDVQITLLD